LNEDIGAIGFENIYDKVKDYELNKDGYSTPLKTRIKNGKLSPLIKKLTNAELKALFTLLSSETAIKACETLHSGRYSSIQMYIISKEIIDRAKSIKIEEDK